MRATDAVTLVAVVTVVLLVSLPRLRHFALRENESDARQVVRALVELVEGSVHAAEPSGGRRADVRELVRADPRLERQWRDVEYLDDGALLRRHGYLFEVVRGPAGLGVRAWPCQHGRTGLDSYVWSSGSGLLVHANRSGVWTGERRPPLADSGAAGWKVLTSAAE